MSKKKKPIEEILLDEQPVISIAEQPVISIDDEIRSFLLSIKGKTSANTEEVNEIYRLYNTKTGQTLNPATCKSCDTMTLRLVKYLRKVVA